MRIKQIVISRVFLPFRMEFSHALRKRLSVKNIIVILLAENNEVLGCGEGAPRSYVTGETADTAEVNIRRLIDKYDFPVEIESIEDIWNYIDRLPGGKEMNASICAVEMALLDAFARYNKKQVIDFFPHDFYTGSISYSTAIPLSSVDNVEKACRIITKLGIDKLKLKVGNDYSQNQSILKIIRSIFKQKYDLKVDANGVWSCESGMKHLKLLNDYNVKIVEQPMFPDAPDISSLYREAQKYNIKLMADESACTLNDLYNLKEEGCYQVINIRLSKCGGLRRSLKMIAYLRKTGTKFQIGCQLGESGLLSSAGRVLCLLSKDSMYYEGSYDNLLLARNTTDRDISFEYGGKAYPLEGEGIGVNIDMNNINEMSEQTSVINFK